MHLSMNSISSVPWEQLVLGRTLQTRKSTVHPQPRKLLLTWAVWVFADIITYRWKIPLKAQHCGKLAYGRTVLNCLWKWIQAEFIKEEFFIFLKCLYSLSDVLDHKSFSSSSVSVQNKLHKYHLKF